MWRLLKILEIELPYDPEIPLLGIHAEENIMKETRVPQCPLQHSLQQLGLGSNVDAHWQMNG